MKSRRHWQYHQTAVLILVFFAFMMSALISRTVFERLPHLEDEIAYLFQAKVFASGNIVADIPEPRGAYWQPFVIDYGETGNRFGKYTPGWPLLLSFGVLIGQWWLMNALFSALTVAVIYRLGREVYSADVGVIAAILAAFSPMALLLNGSLMGHTSALFYAVTFAYAYWRIMQGRHTLRWGILAGVMLGLLVMTRPLTAIAVVAPFVLWSLLRLLRAALMTDRVQGRFWRVIRVLRPLVALGVITLIFSATIPAFNHVATGDAGKNLYTLVWDYDRIGFGECCGRSGHTLEKGIRHTRFDLSLTAADLFGWQSGTVDEEAIDHFVNQSDYYPHIGLSFILLVPGVIVGVVWGLRHRKSRAVMLILAVLWGAAAFYWGTLPLNLSPAEITDPAWGWRWVIGAALIALAPLVSVVWRDDIQPAQMTWILVAWLLMLVIVQASYWIGSQRYSTRYYFEALAPAALLSALPLGWLARQWAGRLKPVIYIGLLCVSLYSLTQYSLPRIGALYRFNTIGQHDVIALEAVRQTDEPVLVLINGASSGENAVRWRAMGTFMAISDPMFKGDVIYAWDNGAEGRREQILSLYPNREIVEVDAAGNEATFRDLPENRTD